MNILLSILILPLKRLWIELEYRHAIKKYNQSIIWEIKRSMIEVDYAFAKAFII